jgi:hypothetical protein
MSLKLEVELKVNPELVKAVLDFVSQTNETKKTPAFVLSEEIKAAFKRGGLDAVDRLITSINNCIKEKGGTAGLGEGAALEERSSGGPFYLHIYFATFEFDNVIARQEILLDSSNAIAPD